ncbi:hypothetical protein Bamb_6467 [Burkholderia ambifaria AMMD]|uniref:Uncharacterized protein n=1 Tax=Burkholderia ambifaria (strain ATCC BAA-244 / DSM 16087 / CCUG 44356 / LMG 19182 / AMMD) TaxID=339670 RepID=Q0B1G2_BURCM|nr:hypothetical protein Bamb_6467 [Burkholderia ambifaria AMMD]
MHRNLKARGPNARAAYAGDARNYTGWRPPACPSRRAPAIRPATQTELPHPVTSPSSPATTRGGAGTRGSHSHSGTSAGGARRAPGIDVRAWRDGITPPTRTARNRRSSIS